MPKRELLNDDFAAILEGVGWKNKLLEAPQLYQIAPALLPAQAQAQPMRENKMAA
jgi:hypothetical protein